MIHTRGRGWVKKGEGLCFCLGRWGVISFLSIQIGGSCGFCVSRNELFIWSQFFSQKCNNFLTCFTRQHFFLFFTQFSWPSAIISWMNCRYVGQLSIYMEGHMISPTLKWGVVHFFSVWMGVVCFTHPLAWKLSSRPSGINNEPSLSVRKNPVCAVWKESKKTQFLLKYWI